MLRKLLAVVLAVACCTSISCSGGTTRTKPTPGTTVVAGPTAVATITALGGVVGLPDGTRVTLPAGALSAPLDVKLSERGSAPKPLGYVTPVGHAVHLDLGGQQLAQPATFEIPIDITKIPKDVTEDQVFAAYFDDTTHAWVPVGGTVDLQRHVLVVQLTHASWWAPWTWNWNAWIASLSKVLDLKLTSLFDLGKSATSKCQQQSDHVTVDDAAGNGIVRGCITKDDAASPQIEVSNTSALFTGLSATGGSAAAIPAQVLGPGESVNAALDTTGAPPLTISADFTQEAMNWFVVDLVVSALPFGDLVPTAGIGEIAHGLSDTSDLSGAIEDLVRGDGVGAAEEIEHFLHDDAFIKAFTYAIVSYGAKHGISTMTKISVSSVKHLLVALTALNVIARSVDFIGNYFFHNHSQVAFKWKSPPCPVSDESFCSFAAATQRSTASAVDATWWGANVMEQSCSGGPPVCQSTRCMNVGLLGSEGACVPKSTELATLRRTFPSGLILFGWIYPTSGILRGSDFADGPALLLAAVGGSPNATAGEMLILKNNGSGWAVSLVINMVPSSLYLYVKPQEIHYLGGTGVVDPAWIINAKTDASIAYTGDDGNIWTVDPAGRNATRITSDGGDSSPGWSPDHQRIAFIHSSAANIRLDAIGADGSGRVTIAPSFPGFSSGPRPPMSLPPEATNVRWSADGCTIYVALSPGSFSGMQPVDSIPLCGGQASQSGFVDFFSVNRDGLFATVAFSKEPPNSLVQIGPLGGPPTATYATDREGPLAWSPDGQELAMRLVDTIVILRADGSLVRTLAVDPMGSYGLNFSIAWSPDGKDIAYQTPLGINVIDALTGAQYTLGGGGEPAW